MRFVPWLVIALAGCGEAPAESKLSGSTGAAGGMDDGKFHPPGNSVHVSEADACKQLKDAVTKQLTDSKCVGTVPADCPGFLRSLYQLACMEYDQGTVNACVDYFTKLKDCDELAHTDKCVVIGFTESAPKGCP